MKGLVLCVVGLVEGLVASEPVPGKLEKPGSLTSQSTSECDGHGTEVDSDIYLCLKYFVHLDKFVKFTRPFLERFQKLEPLIENLTAVKEDLGRMSDHDEKYDQRKTAVNRLLTQYKQESDDLRTVICIVYNKDEPQRVLNLYNHYLDRYLKSINYLDSSTNE